MSLSALVHALVHAFIAYCEAMRCAQLRMLFIRAQPGVIADNPPLSTRVMEEQLRVLASAHPVSSRGFERIQGLRRAVYPSNDHRDGINAFKKRGAESLGALIADSKARGPRSAT